ncbi:MAG: nitric oxide reductase activation protein [Pseudomonadota bacterium]
MLDRDEIIAQLDQWLEVEYTFLDTATLADHLLERDADSCRLMLDWTRRIASTQIPLAYEFTSRVLAQMEQLDAALIESWALHAMDAYDRSGLLPAMALVRDVEQFQRYRREKAHGVRLEEHQAVLRHFVHGLSGRKLEIEGAAVGDESLWGDSETLYLPPVLLTFDDRQDNFQLYKVMVAMLWAQTRFGGFRVDLKRLQQLSPDELALFDCFERLRLEAWIARELPGLYRHLLHFRGEMSVIETEEPWPEICRQLSQSDTTAKDSLRLLSAYSQLQALPSPPYQFTTHANGVAAVMAARIEREKARFKVALNELLPDSEEEQNQNDSPRLSQQQKEESTLPEGFTVELQLDGKPLPPPENMRQLLSSILLDFGELPPDYLVPAGAGDYDPKLLNEIEADPDAVWLGTYHEEGAFLYDEWDHGRQHYRKNWCAVREKTIKAVDDNFVEQTRAKYHSLIKQLRRSFEAMRDEDKLLKRQSDGDEVDLDALVEALADSRDGSEMSSRLFTRMHRSDRNIAVLFMVDMSGSTKGWINEAERESLVLLCEALESLGDRYAIYGFSGVSRKRCDIYTIKTFSDHYDDEIRARIGGIQPQDYTRMGAPIRHLSKILNDSDAKTRLLITLSDGKPDDYSDYKGDYGIEDTRRALIEARRTGIHPYCITIDELARDYLPHMYGAAAYTLVERVEELPQKVADIYRRLTR